MANIQWLDLLRPSDKDIKAFGKKFKIHPVTLDELRSPSARAHVEVFKNYIYFIYYFPLYDPIEETSWRTEIDFVVTKNAVITVHYEEIEALRNFEMSGGTKKVGSSILLAYELVMALLNFQERQLRHIAEKTEAVGQELFKDREKEVLEKISRLKRDVSEYRIIVKHQGPILHSLLNRGVHFGSEEDRPYLNDLVGEHLRIVNQLDDYREAISDFEDTNNQLMNIRTTEVMRTFTILSFLTFPFVLIAAIFDMNLHGTPLTDQQYGFWIVLGTMAVAMSILVAIFKKRGWI
ncbi:MAG: magnesium transporter CorA family protein [Patescibacteria group bacterium]